MADVDTCPWNPLKWNSVPLSRRNAQKEWLGRQPDHEVLVTPLSGCPFPLAQWCLPLSVPPSSGSLNRRGNMEQVCQTMKLSPPTSPPGEPDMMSHDNKFAKLSYKIIINIKLEQACSPK